MIDSARTILSIHGLSRGFFRVLSCSLQKRLTRYVCRNPRADLQVIYILLFHTFYVRNCKLGLAHWEPLSYAHNHQSIYPRCQGYNKY